MLKQALLLLFYFIVPLLLHAQQPDSNLVKTDSIIKTDTSVLTLVDTLYNKVDSAGKKDSISNSALSYSAILEKQLKENRFLNYYGRPVAMVNQVKARQPTDSFFYLLVVIAVALGFFRFSYTHYFNNLFRVFFNASLRQSQLTDQLLQAKLPSLFFNILFLISGGAYVYFLLHYYGKLSGQDFKLSFFYCTISLAAIYLLKHISLKFTGWVTGYKEITNTYIFIIFLINKILGILLIPFTVIIAFSTPVLANVSVILSLLFIGLMLLLRFFRSYGLLQHQLKINSFHFFLYVVGIEIIPVLLIYKGLVLLLSKYL